ncbi:MAG: hypothetical protein AB1753_03595 [Thermoproteota archaeon]
MGRVYYVNWQRQVSVEERAGQKVVVKREKPTTMFHEYVLLATYTAISIMLVHPSPPLLQGAISANEGDKTRAMLARLGIPTPRLISLSRGELVEEYVEGGDLYRAFVAGRAGAAHARAAGVATGRLHRLAGHVFTDNKAQNYLVRSDSVLRTDLGFLQKNSSVFARSMDVGSFLASIIDLESYKDLEQAFFEGYSAEAGSRFPYLSLVLRNLLALGFSSRPRVALANMVKASSVLLGAGC